MSSSLSARPRIRSLADDLRNRSADDLVELLTARPDVLTPVPVDLAALAAELVRLQSVRAAISHLAEQELETLMLLCDPTRASDADLDEAAIQTLWKLALIWGGSSLREVSAIRPVSTVSGLLHDKDAAELAPRAVAAKALVPVEVPRSELLDGQAAIHALEALTRVSQLCEYWAREPAPAIQTGELAHRAVGMAAKELDVDEDVAQLVIDLSLAASLVDRDDRGQAHYGPTLRYDSWKRHSSAEQWYALVESWLGELSVLLLDALSTLDVGFASTTDSLSDYLHLARPKMSEQARADAIGRLFTQGDFLGVTCHGVLSSIARLFLDRTLERTETVAAIDGQLPPTTDEFIAQADLTIVVPGPPNPSLRLLLTESARLESTGGAHVYRFTKESVQWALRRHHGSKGLTAVLQAHAKNELPQPLEYLITDTARALNEGFVDDAEAGDIVLEEPPDQGTVIRSLVAALQHVESADVDDVAEFAPPTDFERMPTAISSMVIHDAQGSGQPVWVGYANNAGSMSVRLVDIITSTGGNISAFDHSTGRITSLAISRVTGAQLASQGGTNG